MRADEDRPSIAWRGVAGMVVYLSLMSASLLLAAGTVAWSMGWFYIGLLLAVTALSRVVAWRRHPELLAERSRFTEVEGVATWDRPIVLYIGVIGLAVRTKLEDEFLIAKLGGYEDYALTTRYRLVPGLW